MFAEACSTKVYLAAGATDMRKSVNGLMLVVSEVLEADPFSEHWFVFCNRRGDKLKILHWQGNGFWLHYRRLEQGRFRWPRVTEAPAAIEITRRELGWLLEGLALEQPHAHRPLRYQMAG